MSDLAAETPYEAGFSMNAATVQRLLAVNRQFYDEFAGSFAASRGFEQPGLHRALGFLPATGAVLDVGCGNGRLAHLLEGAGRATEYLGIDSSVRLLEIARSQAASLRMVRAEFLQIDVTQPGWAAHLPTGRFQGIARSPCCTICPAGRHGAMCFRKCAVYWTPGGPWSCLRGSSPVRRG